MPPAPFRLYDTARRAVLPFEPLVEGEVSLYVCGVTVYDLSHVGHARSFVVFDAFVRWLRHQGWKVRYVRNYTDVDDKIIRRAQELDEDPLSLSQRFIDACQADTQALGLLPPDAEPKVSDTIPGIVDVIQTLIDKGHAYPSEGSVWFDVHSDPLYGTLSGRTLDDLQSSPEQQPGKRDPRDFALWKSARPGEPSWASPWGPGRPGWHIECTAMIHENLGPTIDIHGGGLDLVFPHHENERAQGCCATGQPYARWWMHNGLITRGSSGPDAPAQDTKMGKSLGNVVNIRDTLTTHPAEALRLYYLQAHYRSPLPWTSTSLDEALANLARLYEARETARSLQGTAPAPEIIKDVGPDAQTLHDLTQAFSERFTEALNSDFHTAQALSLAFELARAINRFANHKAAHKRGGTLGRAAAQALDGLAVIGILDRDWDAFDAQVKALRLPSRGSSIEEVEHLIQQRAQARSNRDWAQADALRDRLSALGVVVMDRPEGAHWKLDLAV